MVKLTTLLQDLQMSINNLMSDIDHVYCEMAGVENAYVITSVDNTYCIERDKKKYGKVTLGNRPFIFIAIESAYDVAKELKASNGAGPIVWEVITCAEFYSRRMPVLEENLKLLRGLVVKLESEDNAG